MSGGAVAAKLASLGIVLTKPPVPVANYVPFVKSGNLLHVAGQISKVGDTLLTGKVGQGGASVQDAQKAAAACVVNFLMQLNEATGGHLDAVRRIVKINVFVNSAPDFTEQPAVANGASDLLVTVFGDAGRHARSAVGVAQLPFGVLVEIDGVVDIDETKLHPQHSSMMQFCM